MKKILIQLDSDESPSVFDAITAYDAGVDHILQYGNITPDQVRDLVFGAMFTRGGDDLKNSAVFIGGSNVTTGETVLKAVTESFFGPVSVSVMLDSNGCNTTAVAAVRKILSVGSVKGKKIVILAGTGPVGMRAAGLLAGEGADVLLTSRGLEKSEIARATVEKRFKTNISAAKVSSIQETKDILKDAYAVLCAGAAGITLLPESIWSEHPTLRVLADANAVPPLGIENTKTHWAGKEIDGKVIFGAIGIGGLKMKIHRKCVSQLFTQNDLILDAEEINDIAKDIKE
jgi:methylenetetrahydrofolate/methylenetetrahydromethanopterin dehydrogenase (NADP+)